MIINSLRTKLNINSAKVKYYPVRFTASNALSFTKTVIKSLDAGIKVDVVYTDFEKAFDKVCLK